MSHANLISRKSPAVHVGTAGWSIAKIHDADFPDEGTHLQRYGHVLNAVEINSSFYRPHRFTTYQRWADSVPPRFRFSVKMPRQITHDARLAGSEAEVERFLGEVRGLGDKLGVILVQLPPSAAFDAEIAARFFGQVRAGINAPLALEPRHLSWFGDAAEALLEKLHVARVAADPPRAPSDGVPGGWRGLAYYRLHGSPRIYHSSYGEAALATLRARLLRHKAEGIPAWCIFDNTASFAATANATALLRSLEAVSGAAPG